MNNIRLKQSRSCARRIRKGVEHQSRQIVSRNEKKAIVNFRRCISLFAMTLGGLCPGIAYSIAASEVDSTLPSIFSVGAGTGSNAGPYGASDIALSPRPTLTDDLSYDEANDAVWRHGPALVRLDDTASIALPAGYRYLPLDQAMKLLRLGKEIATVGAIDVPFSLIGPNDGSWTAKIIVMGKGYVPTTEFHSGQAGFDFEKLGVAVQENESRKAPPYIVSQVMWIDDPSWDESHHRLHWAYRVSQIVDRIGVEATIGATASAALTSGLPTTYSNSVTLGRRSAVWLSTTGIDEKMTRWMPIVVERALREEFRLQFEGLSEGIRFDFGEGYEDYRDGDEMAGFGLSDIVSGEALKPQPGLLERMGWLASPRMISGYALLLMVLMRLPWSRAKKPR